MLNNAIKLAIEKGGYLAAKKYGDIDTAFDLAVEHKELTVLDPLFWQALGKAKIWKREPTLYADRKVVDGVVMESLSYFGLEEVWHSLRYHLLLQTNGDTEKFWKELIQDNGSK